MPVVVDTNVILDLVTDDPGWASWSERELTRRRPQGLIVNPVIYAELCVGAESVDEVDAILEDLGIRLAELPREALFIAARAFRGYREAGGNRHSPLPDFFVGAQAEQLGCQLLTRDTGRYRAYFPTVELICPNPDPPAEKS